MAPAHKTRSKSAVKAARHAIKGSRTKDQKLLESNVIQSLVATVLEKEQEMKRLHKERLPKNYYKNLITGFTNIFPTLTVKSLKNAVYYHKQKTTNEEQSDVTTAAPEQLVPSPTNIHVPSTSPKSTKKGRPKQVFLRTNRITYSMAMNEVTQKAVELKQKEGVLKDESFKKIVDEVRENMNLPNDFEIKKVTVRRRILRNKTFVEAHECMGGLDTPLAEIEPSIVEIVLCMSKLRQSLTSSQITQLVNSCIQGTVYEEKLIAFKKRHKVDQPYEKMGKVGPNYTAGFLKRWGHILSVGKARKFELDRSKWARYTNFKHMYDCIEDALITCGLAEKFDEPVWMDIQGNIVKKKEDAFGQKCTIQITHPEYCLVGDEVGGNTSQKGDGHVGGKKVVGEKGCVSQQKASKKEKKFTVIGLTNLRGEPVMCVVIIEGKQRQFEVELGVDHSAQWEGSAEDADFIKRNTGKGKRFPGGPKCVFQGKEVPCFVRFHESGGITGEILLQIFQTMEHHELFHNARANGKTPFVLMDGHGSRFYLPLVQYLNDSASKYCMSIGVPYGTSFWQVGDSCEQNGCFKIGTYRAKEEIMEERERLQMDDIGILPSDIIIVVNRAWEKSFARVEHNKKAIAERGWFPYNRNLLNNDELRVTMTEKEANEDKFLNMEIMAASPSSLSSSSSQNTSISSITDSSATNNCQEHTYINRNSIEKPKLNLSSGMGMHVLKHIVRETDLAKAREMIEQEKKEGLRKKTLLKDMKKITAANMVKCGEFVIGKSIEDLIYEKELARRKAEEEKQERMKARLASQALKQEQATVKKKMREEQRKDNEKKKMIADEEKRKRQQKQYIERYNKAMQIIMNKERLTWNVKDYRTILLALKQKSDGPLPSTLCELSNCYEKWKDRITGEIAMEQTRVEDSGSSVEFSSTTASESQESTDSTPHSQILL